MLHISTISKKFINSILFSTKFKSYPLFSFNYLRFFAFPYIDHDAFRHHALHVLDAPDLKYPILPYIRFVCMYVLDFSALL